MDRQQITEAAQRIEQVLGEEVVNTLGREVGYCQRLRLITPGRLALALLSALGGQAVSCIADLLRSFNALLGTQVAYKPFHNRLAKRQFPDFMRAIAERAWRLWVVKVLGAEPEQCLGEFQRVVLQDGTSFAVKDTLRHVWPGRFYTVKPAAVELHTTLELLSGSPLKVTLTPDTAAERAQQPPPERLTGCLYMGDRGYLEKRYLGQVESAGGTFLVRAPQSINPKVLAIHTPDGRDLSALCDQPLKRIRYHLPRDVPVDLDVEWKDGKQRHRWRLVLTWSQHHGQYLHLVTNLPRERYDAATVRQIYRLRWQVELLFKEWKSHANLHAFNTANPYLAEGLMWAALAAATLKRYLAHAAQRATGVETSTLRAAMSGPHLVPPLIRALRQGFDTLIQAVEKVLRYLAANAQRAHPARDRRKGRSQIGILPQCSTA